MERGGGGEVMNKSDGGRAAPVLVPERSLEGGDGPEARRVAAARAAEGEALASGQVPVPRSAGRSAWGGVIALVMISLSK